MAQRIFRALICPPSQQTACSRSLLFGRRHKDDIFPWNARKPGLRQHHLEHLNLFYYPQDVTERMGPTAMIPYSHYWTMDHDENNANICIEMLHPCVVVILHV